MSDNLEIEAKFLDVDKEALVKKLHAMGAEDTGEDKVSEMLYFDQDLKWKKTGKTFFRIRETMGKVFLTYKNHFEDSIHGVTEHEIEVSDKEQAGKILEAAGLKLGRYNEKIRHKFILDGVIVDIDTWPKIPTYVEIEGPSEAEVKKLAVNLGFDWDKAVFGLSGEVIEKYYGIPVLGLTYFTFDRIE